MKTLAVEVWSDVMCPWCAVGWTQFAKAIEELSFEGALKELEAIVSRLEQGEVDLEDSIALYERGQALKTHCEKKLKSAEGRLEKIVMGANGPEVGEKLETA